ncbi:MAG: thioredoxin domain-containing protein, partial [bacterium]
MKSQYVLPLTIVIAGAFIAGAVFLVGTSNSPTNKAGEAQKVTGRPYDPTLDHVLGNPNAPVKVVEYADLECPFCKTFNTTMHQVMDFYGQSGKVAWVYRPFPLGQIHSKAPKEAEAAECAADQGGDVAFYKYIDQIYLITP